VVVEDPAKLRKAMARVAADVVDLYAGA
jgi:hypothetical protein